MPRPKPLPIPAEPKAFTIPEREPTAWAPTLLRSKSRRATRCRLSGLQRRASRPR
jgi:hypothetical protein